MSAAYLTEDVRVVNTLINQTLNTGGTSTVDSTAVDAIDAAAAVAFIRVGAVATNGVLSKLSVIESDTSGGTYTEVSGSDLAAAGNIVEATMETTMLAIRLNLKGRKRFLKIRATTTAAADTVISYAGFVLIGNGNVPPKSTGYSVVGNVG